MGQFLVATGFLFFLAIMPWLFPEKLPGEIPLPAFLLVGMVLVLAYLPKKRFYFLVLVLASLYDLIAGSSPLYLMTFALCAFIPYFWRHEEKNPWWLILLQVGMALVVQELLFFIFSLRHGLGGWHVLLYNFIPYLLSSLFLVLILRPLVEGVLGLLHYQQFEYHDEVMKGKLG